jgi:DNA-binding NtrC family response regulator
VLVIDDEPLVRWAVSEALSDAGHAVVEASDGGAALEAVATAARPFDVIFLDFRLPDSNEFTLLSSIRTLAPRSVVVLMTASGTPEIVTEAYRLGVDRVLSKPFDIADVQTIVLQRLQSQGNVRGDFHGSTCHQRVPVSVSMDLNRYGNAAGTVDLRDLPALP